MTRSRQRHRIDQTSTRASRRSSSTRSWSPQDNVADTVVADGFYTVDGHLHRRVRRRVRGGWHLLMTSAQLAPCAGRGERALPDRRHQAVRRRPGPHRRPPRRRARVRSSPWSATTAPASPRWSRSSRASTSPTTATSPSPAARSPSSGPSAGPGPRHRHRLPGPRALRQPRRGRQPVPRPGEALGSVLDEVGDGEGGVAAAAHPLRQDPVGADPDRLASPVVSARPSPSPAAWSATPRWSCSTSRPPPWVSPRPPRCST